ncbi:MAG: acetyl-CoA acetyltransferase [Chloroflexi bacterium]|nr:acetyl-CoA acetyltransferase [Chloroflexota bacterium]
MREGIRDKVAIIGTGVTKFGEHWDKSAGDLIVDAVHAACGEANVDLKRDVEAIWASTLYYWSGMSGWIAADPLRFYGKPVTRVENQCASGMDAVRNAAYAVAAGAYDIVVACGVEKLLDQGGRGLSQEIVHTHPVLAWQSAPAYFAPCAVSAFKEWGWSREDLARVAVKNHHNGAKHPKAHFQMEITAEMVLKAPMVAYPLGLFDCCGLSEGAAAVVLTRPDIARSLVGDSYASIKALALAVETQWPYFRPDWTGLALPANVKAAQMAYREAGITNPRRELDFAVVHDCFTITELLIYQDLGLCPPGEATELVKSGVTAIDGEFPVNPDGGLKCFGHPVGATGVRMVAELTKQVLGKAEGYQVKDANIGLAHNLGGPQAIASVAIVGKPD